MVRFRLSILYGKTFEINIENFPIELEQLRQLIKNVLPPFRDFDDYFYTISGKPPHQLNLNDEEQFNKHRTLITNGTYLWMKLISLDSPKNTT